MTARRSGSTPASARARAASVRIEFRIELYVERGSGIRSRIWLRFRRH